MTEQRPWRVPVVVAQIPEQGLQLELTADDATRAALAAAGGLRGVPEAAASVMLTHAGDGKVQASGRVRAIVGQTCVVTLDSVDNVVDETFSVLFVPEGTPLPAAAQPEDDEDPPETMAGGVIDVGNLVTDYLFLGIDPYPRKPGAAFAPIEAASDPEEHPFAALKALKSAARPDAQSGTEAERPPQGRGRAPRKGS